MATPMKLMKRGMIKMNEDVLVSEIIDDAQLLSYTGAVLNFDMVCLEQGF